MATMVHIVAAPTDRIPAVPPSAFTTAPSRKRLAGWKADRQRAFIERLRLTGSVDEACATVGLSSRGVYRLRRRAGAESFAAAWDAAVHGSPVGRGGRLGEIAIEPCDMADERLIRTSARVESLLSRRSVTGRAASRLDP